MPRKPRVESPIDYYHVMMRGNNDEKIFNTKDLKNYFLECIKNRDEEVDVNITTYCVMDNHVHLLLKSDLHNLASFTKKINTKYAIRYNYIKDRRGHVFQDRFRSEAIYDERHLLSVVRYIHNNPVKAKMVNSPHEYKWSSYIEFINKNEIICSKQKELLYGIFGSIDKFKDFHKIEDTNIYLDTKEDIDEFKLYTAQHIISTYFKEKGINHINEIRNQFYHYEAIINLLLKGTTFSNRQIASLVGIDKSIVNTIKKQNIH